MTNGNPDFHSPAWLRASGRQGWLGVEAFFVISGFVIPYALRRSDYRLRDYGTFLLKRIVRLDPPYFASIILAIGLAYISAALPGTHAARPSYSVAQIASHAAYLNGFFGHPSIIPVYWSLSLEFQYYLLMGLVFPLLTSPSRWVRCATLLAGAVLALATPSVLLVFRWLFLFMLGTLAFYYRTRVAGGLWYTAGLILAAAGVCITLGWEAAVVGAASSMLIAFVDMRSTALLFLGGISYSLYLIHVPLAGRVINAGTRLPSTTVVTTLVTLLAAAVAIVSAYAFHRLVERPALAWSRRVDSLEVEVLPAHVDGNVL